jgi:DNA recombination protein RmuC
MDKLATHISQANKDVEEVHRSAKKISSRFEKIEKVEVTGVAPASLMGPDEDDE